MPRHVFFSFHYKRDIFRANVVRNSWRFRGVTDAGYFDKSIWESAHARGNESLRRLISDALVGTTVTAVLIGQETFSREWVHYEIEESRRQGNGLLGIRIHDVSCAAKGSLAALLSQPERPGPNPFTYHRRSGARRDPLGAVNPVVARAMDIADPTIDSFVALHSWESEDGYKNIGSWIEQAASRGHLTRIPAPR
jgi:hypothetical protein